MQPDQNPTPDERYSPPPRSWWQAAPCGHPPEPVAWWITPVGPTCHCGRVLDPKDGHEDPASGAPGPVVHCGECGCHVAIPPKPAPSPSLPDSGERRYDDLAVSGLLSAVNNVLEWIAHNPPDMDGEQQESLWSLLDRWEAMEGMRHDSHAELIDGRYEDAREGQDEPAREAHGMVPGSHERPDGPECRCGAAWSRWDDRCATEDGDDDGDR